MGLMKYCLWKKDVKVCFGNKLVLIFLLDFIRWKFIGGLVNVVFEKLGYREYFFYNYNFFFIECINLRVL